jgi:hypothetical protein
MGSGAFLTILSCISGGSLIVGLRSSDCLTILVVHPLHAMDTVNPCCCCRQVEDVSGDVQLAEEKVGKLEAMGGPQLEAAMAAAQAEKEAQEAAVEQQVGPALCRWDSGGYPGCSSSSATSRV